MLFVLEAGADQLLEEVGLLVGALRRAEAGDRRRAALGMDGLQPRGGQVERLLPRRLAEVRHDLVVVDEAARLLAPAALLAAHVRAQRALGVARLAADERRGQALLGERVVPAVAALDAQAALRARLGAALGVGDRLALVVDVEGQRAADAAVRAHRFDLAQLLARADRDAVDRLVGERAGRAGGHALPAGHARRLAHRVIQVERDARRVALARAADDVVALDVVAGAHAPVAEDARVVVDRDDGVRVVLPAALTALDLGLVLLDAVAAHEHQQLVVGRRQLLRVLVDRRLVDQQQLGELGAVALELGRGGLDLHAVLAGADASGGVDTGADVDDAHAADADRVVALVMAENGDLDPRVLRRLPDRRALRHGDLAAVDRQADGADLGGGGSRDGHCASVSPRSAWQTYGTVRILRVALSGSLRRSPDLAGSEQARRLQSPRLVVLRRSWRRAARASGWRCARSRPRATRRGSGRAARRRRASNPRGR